MAIPLWTAHPDRPEHIRVELEGRIRSFPASFLELPVAGEVFENPDVCQERLQGWTLSQGFDIVRKSGSVKAARPRFEFCCIHHGEETADTRKLEKHVERDEEDKIINRRKQEATSINARSCLYCICLTYKQVGRRGSGVWKPRSIP